MKKKQWKIFWAVVVVCAGVFVFLKVGFPLNTSFGDIFANQKVEKIVVTDGSTGNSRQTTDITKINQFLSSLSKEKLHRSFDIAGRSGWSYRVDFYLNGQNGYYRYYLTYDFSKWGGFSAPLPTGNCREDNTQEVVKIIKGFYTGLK